MSPNIGAVGIKAEFSTWEASGTVANGANISITDDRVITLFSVEHGAVKIEAYNDQDAWTQVQDRVGNLAPAVASTPIVLNGHLATHSTYLRVNNASGATKDYRLLGWMLS